MSAKLFIEDPILSRLLREGFVLPHCTKSGLVVLIRGKAGTGKSTLALQLLDQFDTRSPRFYCSLEQSTADIQYKLASMWAARAINDARTPDYSEPQRFVCRYPLLEASIKRRISAEPLPEEIIAALSEITTAALPLYDEFHETETKATKTAQEKLVDILVRFFEPLSRSLLVAPLNIRGSDFSGQYGVQEGPLIASKGRVLHAVGLTDDIIREVDVPLENRNDRPILVLDGLSLLSAHDREAVEMQGIIERMRRYFQMGILVYEPSGSEAPSLDHHADMVIELTETSRSQPASYLVHELCIRKSRYQEAALGQHQFKIRSHGIAVFPSLHFQVQHPGFMDLELKRSSCTEAWAPKESTGGIRNCKSGSLIDMICAPKPGESVVLLGSRNSFKTQLCTDFLARGSWGCPTNDPKSPAKDIHAKAENGLLVSLIDNAPDIEHGLDCPWHKSLYTTPNDAPGLCKECQSHLLWHARAFCQRPGCITPAEFFHYLRERILPSRKVQDAPSPLFTEASFRDLDSFAYSLGHSNSREYTLLNKVLGENMPALRTLEKGQPLSSELKESLLKRLNQLIKKTGIFTAAALKEFQLRRTTYGPLEKQIGTEEAPRINRMVMENLFRAEITPYEGPQVDRLVFWDLTQMDYRFPLFKDERMLLPAMMDTFKTFNIKSLFMGAGNAENTPAASAMADHVLFCWRSAVKAKNKVDALSDSSLMLYVDRASPSANKSGKALYRIPVFAEDKLRIPRDVNELRTTEKKGGYLVDITTLTNNKDRYDLDQIERITRMQGVK